MYDEFAGAKWAYYNQVQPEARADNCIECGECEAACPQSIQIIDWLANAHEKLTETV
jgi:predicted aldo/keto reductase-like oxidoreductase